MKARIFLIGALACIGCEAVIGAEFDVKEVKCASAQPPARPTIIGENPEFADVIFGALTTVDFGDRLLEDKTPAYRTIGYDLDGVCALQGARPSCTPFGWAKPDVANGLDGRDNHGGFLILDQEAVFNMTQFSSDLVNKGIRRGERAPAALVRVTRYNHRTDDDQVDVDWYVPLAYERGGAGPPTLGPTDAWPVWKGTVDDPDALKAPPAIDSYPPSKFRDAHAYVTGSLVVARMPKGTPFKLSNVAFTMDDLVVTLKLAGGGGAAGTSEREFFIESAMIAGHVGATQLFQKMPSMTDLFAGTKICSGDGNYPKVKRYFCSHIDSHIDGRNAPDAPCDAISFGINYVASRARMGAAFDELPFVGCAPEVDPGNDSCDVPVAVPE